MNPVQKENDDALSPETVLIPENAIYSPDIQSTDVDPLTEAPATCDPEILPSASSEHPEVTRPENPETLPPQKPIPGPSNTPDFLDCLDDDDTYSKFLKTLLFITNL